MTQMQQGTPKTWFSGDSSPEDKKSAQNGFLIGLLVATLALPVAMIMAFLSYVAFANFRIKHTVIFQVTALIALLFGITGLLTWSIKGYIPAFTAVTGSFAEDADTTTGAAIAYWIWVSAPLSIVVGLIVGSTYCAIRWLRRSVWETFDFRPTIIETLKLKKSISDIRNNVNSPSRGATIGVTDNGEKIIQTEEEAAPHTLITGASNSGKTTTRLTGLRDLIRQGSGVVILDMKADPSLAETAYEYAERYNRNFYHFTYQNQEEEYTGPSPTGPAYYDNLSRGEASRRKDMIIGGRTWESDYYKNIASNYLQTAFDVMIKSPNKNSNQDALGDIIELLVPGVLAERARNVVHTDHTIDFLQEVHMLTSEKLDKNEASVLDGLRHELVSMRNSSPGRWLRRNPSGAPGIDITKAAYEGDVIVFSLDALGYEQVTKLIANFILGDLKTVASELAKNLPENPLHIFIDEFAALGSETILNLINKCRSSNMAVTLATQTLGDLERVDTAFLKQVMGIINAYMIHRPNTYEEAELLAGLGSKDTKWDITLGVEHTSGIIGGIGRGAATGEGRVQSKQDYTIDPSDIMKLKRGECYYIAKSPDQRIKRVKVIPERNNLTTAGNKQDSVEKTPTVKGFKRPSRVEYVPEEDLTITEYQDQDQTSQGFKKYSENEDEEFLRTLREQRSQNQPRVSPLPPAPPTMREPANRPNVAQPVHNNVQGVRRPPVRPAPAPVRPNSLPGLPSAPPRPPTGNPNQPRRPLPPPPPRTPVPPSTSPVQRPDRNPVPPQQPGNPNRVVRRDNSF